MLKINIRLNFESLNMISVSNKISVLFLDSNKKNIFSILFYCTFCLESRLDKTLSIRMNLFR